MNIGDQLRQAREQRNVSLHAIAEKTNISVRFLDAIEKGHVDKLPGGIFTRGFVRSYASQVGLDPDDTVRAYVAAHPQLRTDDEVDEQNQGTGHRPTALIIGLVVVVAVLALAAVYWWMGRPASAPVAAVATPRPVDVPMPASPADDAEGGVGGAPLLATPASATGPSAAPAAATAPVPPGGEPSAGIAASPLRLLIAPVARCWVQVKADGQVRLAREVAPGEQVDIDASTRLEIVAGDAGAFAYQVNGVPGRALGPAGRVGRATITTDTVVTFQDAAR